MNESMRKIVYYENILEFKRNTKTELHLHEVNNWQLCRTCLVESKEGDWDLNKMCVMDAQNGKFLNAQDMLDKVTAIELNKENDLPLKMCKDCLEKLTTLYFFSIQVKKAEKVLKNLSLKLKREGVEDDNADGLQEQNSADNKEEHINSIHCDSDTQSVVTADAIVEKNVSPKLTKNTKQRGSRDDVSLVVVDDDGSVSAETASTTKSKEETSASKVDEQKWDVDKKKQTEIDNVLHAKQEVPKSESPLITGDIDSNELIVMEVEEDFQEYTNNDFDFEVSKESDETLFDNEDVETTVEIYLSDEMEEHLEQKHNWMEENENDEGDVEIVIPNTLISSDETSNISCPEPVHITKATRVVKTKKKSLFKHKQKRVTKPLLESRKCDVCQETFKLQRDLVSHVKVHHPNSKAYQCRECGQLFSYTQSLSRHMNTHKDELHKNKCSYCPKAFLRNDDLVRHIRTHTGERPYKCPKCNKAFKQQGEMKQHLQTHLEKRAYECDHCFCVFTSRNSLYLHKKSKHSNSSKVRSATRKVVKVKDNS